jgi:CDP-diacylglycerol pyrophosphatase
MNNRYILAVIAVMLGSACQHRDKLWQLVHGCDTPSSAGCAPLAGGFAALQSCEVIAAGAHQCVAIGSQDAVLKDLHGRLQYLLLSRARRTGIESPELLAPGEPNYWQDAWNARTFMEGRLGRSIPPDDIALSVNSADARSQDQLHIHIDCVRAEVRDALRQHAPEIGDHWAPFPEPLAGHSYFARRVSSLTPDPFRLLAEGVPGAREAMAHYTLVVVGAKDGWVVLADRSAGMNRAHGEELQDQDCGVLDAR